MGSSGSSMTSGGSLYSSAHMKSSGIETDLEKFKQTVNESSSASATYGTYRFNIYHRIATVDDDCTKLERSHVGHFFLSLQCANSEKYFGKYSIFGKCPCGPAKIESLLEAKIVKCLKKFEIEDELKYYAKKSFTISRDEYEKAFEYAAKCKRQNAEMYIACYDDCTDFVQRVYNAAGLPLYFTAAYLEHDAPFSFAAKIVQLKYKCLDEYTTTFKEMSANSGTDLAAELNVDAACVLPYPRKDGKFFVDLDVALKKIMSQQGFVSSARTGKTSLAIPQAIRTNKDLINQLRVDNLINLVIFNLQNRFDDCISKVEMHIKRAIRSYPLDTKPEFKQKIRTAFICSLEAKIRDSSPLMENETLPLKQKTKESIVNICNEEALEKVREEIVIHLIRNIERKFLEPRKKAFENCKTPLNEYLIKETRTSNDDNVCLDSQRSKFMEKVDHFIDILESYLTMDFATILTEFSD